MLAWPYARSRGVPEQVWTMFSTPAAKIEVGCTSNATRCASTRKVPIHWRRCSLLPACIFM